MQERGLTSSRLAELVGVRPSAVSHILSGRNNPGYDFIVGLLKAFPDIDPRRLLLEDQNSGQSDLFVGAQVLPDENITNRTNDLSRMSPEGIYSLDESLSGGGRAGHSSRSVDISTIDNTPPFSSAMAEREMNHINAIDEKGSSPGKPTLPEIERVIVLYDDGTFRTYKAAKE